MQRGGFALGLVVGLLVGLALALAVALYVTKVPVPFVDRVPQRTPEQDAAEAERNKRWDPNGPLVGRPPVRQDAPASAPAVAPPPAAAASAARDPAAILAGRPVPPVAGSPIAPPSASAPGPTPALAPGLEPFRYFVQVGAYSRMDDAEQQRARLAMLGFAAQISEREQAGRTVYRVRLGPFDRKELADAAQERLKTNEVESALVRVER
jgi:cell division protein FtsN